MAGGGPICVSGMAALSWAVPDEIAMYARTGTELVGLPAAKAAAYGAEPLARLLDEHGLGLGYLVQPFTARPEDDEGWDVQLAALAAAVRDAAALGAQVVYLTSGPSGHLDWEHAAEVFVRRTAPLVRLAESEGVALAIENTMSIRSDLSFTHTARDAFILAEQAGIGVCLDLYCCWQERGLAALVADRVQSIRIVQVSDFVLGTSSFPSRWVPGDADLPIRRLLGEVLSAGYRGIVDAELIGPAIEGEGVEAALTRSVAWMRARLADRRAESATVTSKR